MLTRSEAAGVDIFARVAPSRFIFFQGHPEYDALSLQREYMRDIGRFLAGQRDDYPNLPTAYFDSATEDILTQFEARARVRRDPTLAAGTYVGERGLRSTARRHAIRTRTISRAE